jgi:hypothetical protein
MNTVTLFTQSNQYHLERKFQLSNNKRYKIFSYSIHYIQEMILTKSTSKISFKLSAQVLLKNLFHNQQWLVQT